MVKEWNLFVSFLQPWTIGDYPTESLQVCLQNIFASMLSQELSIESNDCNKDGTSLVIWHIKKYDGKTDLKKATLAIRLNNLDSELSKDMKQLGCPIGLSIGKTIKLYYNYEKLNKVISACNIALDAKDPNGNRLFSLLTSEKFNPSLFDDYCCELLQKVNSKELILDILEPLFKSPSITIKHLLEKELMSNGFQADLINSSLKDLEFKIVFKGKNYPAAKESNIQVEKPSSQITLDKTKFSYDGEKYYSKRKFVLAVVKQYVKDNPKITYKKLNEFFRSDIINKKRGIVRQLDTVNKWIQENPDLKNRYCLNDDEIITLQDGDKIVVYNQWGKNTFPKFLQLIEGIYTIRSDRDYSEYTPSSNEGYMNETNGSIKTVEEGIHISQCSLQSFKKGQNEKK